jgi:hypothetical protein
MFVLRAFKPADELGFPKANPIANERTLNGD